MLCTSNATQPPRKWPTVKISYDQPDWYRALLTLVQPGAVVVFEPTGWHYARPVITALAAHDCSLWQVPTNATGHIRDIHISPGKSDRTDAQALALAATWIAAGHHIPGAYPHHNELEDAVTELRLLINTRARAIRSRTRILNQIDQLGFSLWPALVQKKEIWLRAARVGAITPAQVKALAADPCLMDYEAYQHGNARNALKALAEMLPAVDGPPATVQNIRDLLTKIDALTDEAHAISQRTTDIVSADPFQEVTERWRTIPYAVPKQSDPPGNLFGLATLHVACRGRAQDFARDEFKKALGAHPKTRQSGDAVRRDRIKAGYRPAMTTLYTWAMVLVKPNAQPNPIRDYFQTTATQYRMQATVRKLAHVLWGVARDPAGYHYP